MGNGTYFRWASLGVALLLGSGCGDGDPSDAESAVPANTSSSTVPLTSPPVSGPEPLPPATAWCDAALPLLDGQLLADGGGERGLQADLDAQRRFIEGYRQLAAIAPVGWERDDLIDTADGLARVLPILEWGVDQEARGVPASEVDAALDPEFRELLRTMATPEADARVARVAERLRSCLPAGAPGR